MKAHPNFTDSRRKVADTCVTTDGKAFYVWAVIEVVHDDGKAVAVEFLYPNADGEPREFSFAEAEKLVHRVKERGNITVGLWLISRITDLELDRVLYTLADSPTCRVYNAQPPLAAVSERRDERRD